MHPRLCTEIQQNKTNETFDGNVSCIYEAEDVGIASSDRGTSGYGKFACGYCDTNCLYNSVDICLFIGVVANALVIASVIRDKKLQDPTFIGIAALALPDLLFLLLHLTISVETVVISYTCQPPKILSRPWYILNSMIWFSANSHVAFLAVLRFLTIAYPIKSSIYLTPKRVILLSAGVWILGIILMGTLAGLITLKIVVPGPYGEFIIIWWITVYLIPLIVTTILHILKICRVKKATRNTATLHTRRSLNRMAKVVPLVIIMATVLPLPKLIYNCIRTVSRNGNDIFPSKNFKMHFNGIAQLVYLINHFINPFIYGFLSKKFRNSLKEMLSCFKFKCTGSKMAAEARSTSRNRIISSTETITRNLSSVSSMESTDNHKSYNRVCSLDSNTSSRKCESVSSIESLDNSRNIQRF